MDDMHNGLCGQHHHELTVESLISPQIVALRGYKTVKAEDLPNEFADYQKRDGLLIPISTVRGKIESYQLKPFEPRIGKNGKPIKYETAANAPQVIDVPPEAHRLMGEPNATLIITEGAKKVDSAHSQGLWTTIGLQGVYGWRGKNAQGGTTALPDWESFALKNRETVIAFDSDVMTKDTVRSALDRLAAFLTSRGAKVKYLVLPDLPDGSKQGLDDFFANGGKPDDLDQYLKTELEPLTALKSPDPKAIVTAATPITRRLSEVEEKQIDWLWPGWLPRGMFSLLGGYAGDGKSTITMALAAALSRGGLLPDGAQAPVVNTLIMAAEDDISYVVKPRLAVHDADMDRIFEFQHVKKSEAEEQSVNLRAHMLELRQSIIENQIGLVIIDPLSSYLANGDRNNEGDVRDTLQPLVKLMEETGCTVLGIMHHGKNSGHVKSYQGLMGSTAFTALARAVWQVQELPEEFQAEGAPTRKMLAVSKSNYAVQPPALQFCRPLDAALEWMGQSPISLEQAESWKPKSEKAETETEKAEAWLVEFMDGKRVLASEVESAAKAEGISKTTLHMAKKKINVKSCRVGSQWMWQPSDVGEAGAA